MKEQRVDCVPRSSIDDSTEYLLLGFSLQGAGIGSILKYGQGSSFRRVGQFYKKLSKDYSPGEKQVVTIT